MSRTVIHNYITIAHVKGNFFTLPKGVTEAELRFGARRLDNAKRLAVAVEEFLKYVDIYPWTSAAAREYAELRTLIEREGRPMGNLDLMIAAHALALGAVLVTSDRVFRRVKRLKLEDWARA